LMRNKCFPPRTLPPADHNSRNHHYVAQNGHIPHVMVGNGFVVNRDHDQETDLDTFTSPMIMPLRDLQGQSQRGAGDNIYFQENDASDSKGSGNHSNGSIGRRDLQATYLPNGHVSTSVIGQQSGQSPHEAQDDQELETEFNNTSNSCPDVWSSRSVSQGNKGHPSTGHSHPTSNTAPSCSSAEDQDYSQPHAHSQSHRNKGPYKYSLVSSSAPAPSSTEEETHDPVTLSAVTGDDSRSSSQSQDHASDGPVSNNTSCDTRSQEPQGHITDSHQEHPNFHSSPSDVTEGLSDQCVPREDLDPRQAERTHLLSDEQQEDEGVPSVCIESNKSSLLQKDQESRDDYHANAVEEAI